MAFEYSDENRVLTVLHYDPTTNEYLSTQADYVVAANAGIPGNSTIVPLPSSTPGGYAYIFNVPLSSWQTIENLRGRSAYPKDPDTHSAYVVSDLGPLPDTHTLLVPGEGQMWGDSGWVEDPAQTALRLANVKTGKVEELTAACGVAIVGGFTANVVDSGQHYTYDSREVDQTNLIMALAAADLEDQQGEAPAVQGVLCNDPSGQLGMIERDHTALQIRGVLAACNTHRRAQSTNLTTKLAQVSAAATEAQALAANW